MKIIFSMEILCKFLRIFKLESDFFHIFLAKFSNLNRIFFHIFLAKSENSKIVHIYLSWTTTEPIFSEIGEKKKSSKISKIESDFFLILQNKPPLFPKLCTFISFELHVIQFSAKKKNLFGGGWWVGPNFLALQISWKLARL